MNRRLFNGLRQPVMLLCLMAALAALPATADRRCSIAIDANEAAALADEIWRNESGRDMDKILWWNRGEEFASLGIGHFIWYPAGVEGPFRESFPGLLIFLSSRGVALPGWLADGSPWECPWATREQFMQERTGPKATALRRLLVETMPLQAEFMLARLQSAMGTRATDVPVSRAVVVESRFCALSATPSGRYALVDYVNFKGEGTHPGERYEGEGWGLEQVLMEMDGKQSTSEGFADAAAKVLIRRVHNAPPERHEERWLPGWLRRIDTYRRQ